MRIVSGTRIAPVALAAALVLALAACVPAPPPVTLPPQPSSTPLFASEEEALAAAEEVYGAYSAAANELAQVGWRSPELVEPFTTIEYFATVTEFSADLAAQGNRQDGVTTFDSLRIQAYNDGDTGLELSAYVCVDVSDTRILDPNGRDVTPQDRQLRLPSVITVIGADRSDLRVSGDVPWDGPTYC